MVEQSFFWAQAMVRTGALLAALLVAVFVIAGCGGDHSTPPSALPPPALTPVASGFNSPLGLEQAGDGSGRLFVVEQGGTIKIIQNGSVLPAAFLDVSSKVTTGAEMGLLGVTFHPNYSANGKLYVNYTRTSSGQIQSVIAEYTASPANANQVNIATERILLTVDQVGNFMNHKAGQLAFGPDGLLYFGLGDGGGGGDPFGHGQNTATLLGKMMRIDVNSTDPGLQYHIPADNPFAAGGGLPEIWAFGFRNPWRFSFDRGTGRLFVADVGQDAFEEVDIVQKGGNYGWNIMEGMHCFNPPSGCNTAGLILPITEYSHAEGNAVIGGFVYRGSNLPTLRGVYIFGDLGTGKIFALQETSSNVFTRTPLLTTGKTISSFGQDQAGELYLVDIGAGTIFKLAPN
ncbi:MAG TPA: PQQ-dependent sugar dehydrogenase [Candidatus Angelobacter sp.]|nr:PQQ-dependent sugar dehydrogenase [Candidatus Angelobacter sp.]